MLQDNFNKSVVLTAVSEQGLIKQNAAANVVLYNINYKSVV